ncbi:Acyl-CoA carboxylase epsilon subunit [Jatrophihabitans endophyticus]|uniref:Acyl-CoA carboxylase epsilon subunit n=1 Tax=Jatrophihabitans endophyticus TaxID=1206085 RepID=A0A1M5G5G9_9ACTN|nr:acyl-CoA carboxylase epsilon subunit [Jatrophihabitans endophyticus]SHF98976.1 Acyl-CoA carboxylase epsilon subunit [Jatrophihabitans endophyticus]
MTADGVRVRGAATAEELAAVVAVVRARGEGPSRPDDPYLRWRRTRLAALREDGPGPRPWCRIER